MDSVLTFGSVSYLFTCQAGEPFKSFVSKPLGTSKGFLQARKRQKYGILTGKNGALENMNSKEESQCYSIKE